MYIYEIEIDNFKSFNGKTTVPFRPGFTTVSGPNGSGKSNIIDSVLFCLGLSTSRTMRAEKLTDLINNLSRRREALVTITFRKDDRDIDAETGVMRLVRDPDSKNETPPPGKEGSAESNSSETASAENNQAENGENSEFITVARRIKDGASGYTSTYYLNGRPTTLTEIHEYLGKFHISPGCYNVMMQGDVAGFVNMSAVERRKIIDEIAGVAEFDRKIEQAQKELAATGANIERNQILLGEIELRLAQLSEEREHALKYQKLRDEKQSYEQQLLAAKFMDLKKALAATHQNIIDAKKHKEETQKRIAVLNEAISETRDRLLALANEVKRKGEDQQIALKKQIEGLKGHISRKEDSIRFIDQQVAENAQSVERMKEEILRQKENVENIDSEIEGFNHQLKELQGLFKNEATDYEKLNKRFDALTDSGGELNVKRSEIRKQLEAAEDELSDLNRTKLDIEADTTRHTFDRETRLRGQSEFSEKQATLSERKQELTKQVKDLDLEKAAFEAQLRQTQMDYSKGRVALNELQGRFQKTQQDFVRLEAKRRAYDEVGFARSVEMVLNSGLGGVHGTLGQLGSVDPEFAVALEIALGGRIQNVVVEDDSIAQQAIEHLQRNKGGRATFLPLNKLQPARTLPLLPDEAGVVDFAYNLIEFDTTYSDAFAYALGETVVVEDMASARRLLRKYRMVTRDGSLLEKSGAMSGGTAPSGKAGGQLANHAKLDQEIEESAKALEKIELEKERAEKQLTQLELKLEGLKEEYGQCVQKHNRATVELEGVTAQLAELDGKTAQSVDVSEIDARLKELAKNLAAIEKTREKQIERVDVLQSELDAIENQLPSDQIDQLRKEIAEVKFQMDHYDSQIRNVQADIKGKQMEREYQNVGIQEFENRIEQTKKQSIEVQKEKLGHQEEIDLTLVQIKDLEAQTTELDEELKKLQEERDAVQNELIEQEKNKNIQERELHQLDEQILSFQARKREIEPELDAVREELEAAEIDPDTLDENAIPSEEEIHKNIQRLTRKMEAMEPVNMLAIKEYDDVNERKNELADKINTLNSEREALNVRISGYEELKLSSFMRAFENVDNNFKSIFAELSDGTGQLILTNPESPFEGGMVIQAQPRGKKMQRIEAMSGGEKSLTSLAFVFSLQRYMPAPFYALDEVDMNLDGINAEKLANMIKRESIKGAQFVVVSLRKPMIENSDRTVGVTQKRDGITKVTGIKLRHEDAADAHSADTQNPQEDTTLDDANAAVKRRNAS